MLTPEDYAEIEKRLTHEIEELSNEELLNMVIGMGGGDDWDGCGFTEYGQWEFDFFKGKLVERLKTVGWL